MGATVGHNTAAPGPDKLAAAKGLQPGPCTCTRNLQTLFCRACKGAQVGKLVVAPETAAAAHNHPIDSLQPHPRSTP